MARLSNEELIAIGREMLERLQGVDGQSLEVKTDRIVNMAHAPLVHALSTHTLRLGTVGLDLHERGLFIEAVPTVRAAYESALTASWLADSREAPAALANEDERQRRALADAMERANSLTFQEGADEIRRLDVEPLKTSATAQARWFEQLCHALHPGGSDAYVLYRAMSAFAHPSAALGDKYIQLVDDHPAGVTLLEDPNDGEKGIWLPILVASMLWASRAIDVMHRDRPNRSYLRDVARQLRVAEVLRLSPAAREIERLAEQDRKRASWKGPRRKQRPRSE